MATNLNTANVEMLLRERDEALQLLREIIDDASKSTTSGELLVAERLIERAREILGERE